MNPRLGEWTDLFLTHVRGKGVAYHVAEDEGYKFRSVDMFQRRFDLDAPDLEGMLDKAIEPNNLVMGAMYFPRKMLLIFARDYTEETRAILGDLYDESKDVSVRLTQAMQRFEDLLARRLKSEGATQGNSYMGLRFLSLMLSYRYPDRYNAMKPREWKVFCRYVDESFAIPNHTPIGDQYERFSEHVDALIAYLKVMPAIDEIRKALTQGQGISFSDDGYRWIAQDVIYVTAKHLAGERDTESAATSARTSEDEPEEDIESTTQEDVEQGAVGRFPLEQHLERFMVANWDHIDFGEPLALYRDEDGTPGEQYTTDVGIIDLLAIDAKGNFVVIELKRGKSTQHVIGQILAYMGWVRRNLATNGQSVRGIVIASDSNAALDEALVELGDKVTVRYYRVSLQIITPTQN